ncbi:MAG: hypothetical protein K6E94_03845 [Elusimicrobiaceae bacterium]|nr:hypothetical protein [Elusimicrobiaceae bacterium]
MEFSGQYLTYDEYRGLGGTLDLTPFNLLEFQTRKEIELRTKGRLSNLDVTEIPEEVKLCEYHLMSLVQQYAETMSKSNNGVASENIDGYSVSYLSPTNIQEIIKSKQKEFDDIMLSELYNVIVNNEAIIYCG